MKKFIVEYKDTDGSKDILTAKDVKRYLLSNCFMSFGCEWEVAELPSIPEVKKKETGTMSIPGHTYIGSPSKDYKFHNGSLVPLEKYPELRTFCKDIRTDWDFSSIPEGALIEVVDEAGIVLHGIFDKKHYDKTNMWFGCYKLNYSEIKSIRIVELAKEGNK